jgi:glutaredoxin
MDVEFSQPFEKPQQNGYTIYSKSGCSFCVKAKILLAFQEPYIKIIDCDDYLAENREKFLIFIKNLVGYKYNTFPMVFHNNQFIGGFNETKTFYDKNDAFSGVLF